MDLNPLTTPQNCLHDCLNGTLITFNGNEFTLQNDAGNIKLEGGTLPNGFIPVGMKEYGGIIYTALLNPITKECQIGSIPSPNYASTPVNHENGVNITFNGNSEFKDKIIKLFEQEQLLLNPGDKYKIIYKVNTSDISKLYNLDWIILDENNKEYELKNPNVVLVDDSTNYEYFNQTIQSVIALKITLDELDWFEVSGSYKKDETSDNYKINLQLFGINKLKNSGIEEDDLYIRGCELNYNNKTSYIWDKDIYDAEQSGTITESILKPNFQLTYQIEDTFIKDEEVILKITPFDKFKMLPNLSKSIYLQMVESMKSDKLNNIFQYKYSENNNKLTLWFDTNLIGIEDPQVYLEFYDVWSNCSTIIDIDNPNQFGTNMINIDTTNEELTKIFNDNVRGGINMIDLDILETSTRISPQLPSDETINGITGKLKRKNKILRPYNLYIVRICIISKINELKEYNIYKPFILNSAFNYITDIQKSDPNYYDYTILKPTQFLNLEINNEQSYSIDPFIITENKNLSLNTNNNYYKLSDSPITKPTNQYVKLTASQRLQNFNDISIKKNKIYGNIKSLNISNLELKDSKINLHDSRNWENQSNYNVTLSNNNNRISVISNFETIREIKTDVYDQSVNIINELETKSYYDCIVKNYDGTPFASIEPHGNVDRPRQIRERNSEKTLLASLDSGIDNIRIQEAILKKSSTASGGILYWEDKPKGFIDIWGDRHANAVYYRFNGTTDNIPKTSANFLLCLYSNNLDPKRKYFPVKISDRNSTIEALKDICVSKTTNITRYKYWYGNIKNNIDSVTKVSSENKINFNYSLNINTYFKKNNTDVESNNIFIELNKLVNNNLDLNSIHYLNQFNESYSDNIIINTQDQTYSTNQLNQTLEKLTTSEVDLINNESNKLSSFNRPNNKPYSKRNGYSELLSRLSYEDGKFVYSLQNLKQCKWAVSGAGLDTTSCPWFDDYIFTN